MNNFLENKNGNAILLGFFVLSMILIIALSAGYLVVQSLRLSRTQVESTKSYYAGEAGLERILWESRYGDFDYSDCLNGNGECAVSWDINSGGVCAQDCSSLVKYDLENGSSYTIKYFKDIPNKEEGFSAIGSFGKTKRKVEAAYVYK